MKLLYYSANGNDLNVLEKAVEHLVAEKSLDIELLAISKHEMSDEFKRREVIEFLKDTDLILFRPHGGIDSCPGFDEVIEIADAKTDVYIHACNAAAAETAAKYSTMDALRCYTIRKYLDFGGINNFRNLLLYLAQKTDDTEWDECEPLETARQGVYHPEFPVAMTLQEYKKSLKEDVPTIGIWFHREHWINLDLEYVDALIRSIESRGANAIAVFRSSRGEEELGNMGPTEIVQNYFMEDGKPIVECLVNMMMFSQKLLNGSEDQFYEILNVPVIKGMLSFSSEEDWNQKMNGLEPVELCINAALPEIDGNLISYPIAFMEPVEQAVGGASTVKKYKSNMRQVEKLISLAINWGNLSRKLNTQKKVAIIFHNYPPKDHNIGTAFGLDSHESVINILKEMKESGYLIDWIPDDGAELIDKIMERVTNERGWTDVSVMAQKAVDIIPTEIYGQWFERLDKRLKRQIEETWGRMPGDLFKCEKGLMVPGIINGNVFIGIQPPRGYLEDGVDIYHSPDLPIPHNYYAYYEWIRNTFGADAVIHVGMHGNLEWLPGKSVGLSSQCYPEAAIADLPNIYPYIINNPSEGTQAKRRSYCCIIEHLIPVMRVANLYEELDELEQSLNEYYQAKLETPSKLSFLREQIWEKVSEANLHFDLNYDEDRALSEFDSFLEKLHGYLSELKDTQIRDGLHVLGESPEGELLVEFLVTLTRLSNGETPSLREAIAQLEGFDLYDLQSKRGQLNENGTVNGDIIDKIQEKAVACIRKYSDCDFEYERFKNTLSEFIGETSSELLSVMTFIGESLVPNLLRTEDELINTIRALGGEHISAGPSGSPSRGMAHILPTGRNFYSVDPMAMPTKSAWKIGENLAVDVLDRYLKEEGKYPESIGMIFFGGTTMRTKGDDIAEALYLMGVKPVWKKSNGHITGLEIIPLEELGRPRIDVTVKISGFFRDAFPNIIELFDEAIQMLAFLDEPHDMNYIAKHVSADMEKWIEEGHSKSRAEEEACYRIFGCKPGSYGAGVSDLIDSRKWDTQGDLADIFMEWGSYAYTSGRYGDKSIDTFKRRLSKIDIAVKNIDHRERGILDSDDYYTFHGGMIAAVKKEKGKVPKAYIGDSSDGERVCTKTVEEEIRREFRTRIFNPQWLESMQRHGYKGASDISQSINFSFGWDATADAVDDWIYETYAEKIALNEAFKEWFEDVNPWALKNMTEVLLEAIQRGLWDADDQMKQDLQLTYLSIEGDIEGK